DPQIFGRQSTRLNFGRQRPASRTQSPASVHQVLHRWVAVNDRLLASASSDASVLLKAKPCRYESIKEPCSRQFVPLLCPRPAEVAPADGAGLVPCNKCLPCNPWRCSETTACSRLSPRRCTPSHGKLQISPPSHWRSSQAAREYTHRSFRSIPEYPAGAPRLR